MITLRDQWSNSVLHVSAFISRKKMALPLSSGFQGFVSVLAIIGAELLLLILSLPSYLAVQNTVNTKRTEGYQLRRTLTRGTIATLLIIWAIKLVVILFVVWNAHTYGTVTITETNNQSATIETRAHDVLIAETSNKLLPPTIISTANTHTAITVTGTGVKNTDIIFTFSEINPNKITPPKIYSTPVDASGNFTLNEDKQIFNLPSGNYTVSAISYDPLHQTKSANSRTFIMPITESFIIWFSHTFDTLLNILALIAISIGILTTILVT